MVVLAYYKQKKKKGGERKKAEGRRDGGELEWVAVPKQVETSRK